ncbi:BRCT domain-containing protein [Lutibacter sp.]
MSKKTNFVIAGENIGPSKRLKAESLKIPIISEKDYINMIN